MNHESAIPGTPFSLTCRVLLSSSGKTSVTGTAEPVTDVLLEHFFRRKQLIFPVCFF